MCVGMRIRSDTSINKMVYSKTVNYRGWYNFGKVCYQRGHISKRGS